MKKKCCFNCLVFLFALFSFNAFGQDHLRNSEDIQSDEIKLLLERKTMLTWHEYTAWGALGLMGLSFATAPEGKSKNFHNIVGYGTGALYLSSAFFAYSSPKFKDVKDQPKIVWHKRLIYIHAPAMLLTALSGYKAAKERKEGKPLSSFAKAHKAFAGITAISFGLGVFTSYDLTFDLLSSDEGNISGGIWKITKRF